MMDFTGRVLEIRVLTPNVAQIVFEKRSKNKKVFVAMKLYGFWKEHAEILKVRKGDKLTGTVILSSKLIDNRYFTDVLFTKFERVVEEKKKDPNQMSLIPHIEIKDETGKTRL